jgi:hypothetical protein
MRKLTPEERAARALEKTKTVSAKPVASPRKKRVAPSPITSQPETVAESEAEPEAVAAEPEAVAAEPEAVAAEPKKSVID